MKKNLILPLSILLGLILAACGGSSTTPPQPDPGEVATVVAATMGALTPATTSEPPAQKTNPENLTIIQPPPAQDSDSDVPVTTQEPEPPITYTADGSQCTRTGPNLLTTSGFGQPIYPPFESANPSVLLKLESPEYNQRLAFSSTGDLLISSSSRSTRLWEVSSGRQLHEIPTSAIDFSFLPGDAKALLLTPEQRVISWQIDSGQETLLTQIVQSYSRGSLSPDGRWIAGVLENDSTDEVESWRNIVGLWDASSGEMVQQFQGKVLEVVDPGSPWIKITFAQGHFFGVNSISFSPNGQAVLTAGSYGAVRLWDLRSGEHLRCYEPPSPNEHFNSFVSAGFSPDGKKVFALLRKSRQGDKSILIWDAATGQLTARLEPGKIAWGAISPDGSAFLTDGVGFSARWWDVESGALLKLLRHPGDVGSAALHPSGDKVVTSFSLDDEHQLGGTWIWDLTHPALAAAAEALKLSEQSIQLLEEGQLEAALQKAEEATALDPNPGAGIGYLGKLCRHGGLWNWPEQVLPACDRAVDLAQLLGDTHNSILTRLFRGIARARSGDLPGSQQDLDFCVTNAPGSIYAGEVDTLREWIGHLQQGQNPFDEGTLYRLRYIGM